MVNIQRIFPHILPDQAKAQSNNEEHDPAVFPADVRVDPHGKPQAQQEEQQREEYGKRIHIHRHGRISSRRSDCIHYIMPNS